MKIFLTSLFFALSTFFINAQKSPKLLKEGIELHNRGQYYEAIEIYNAILKKNNRDVPALMEKAYSLFSLYSFDECITICDEIISISNDPDEVSDAYLILGNALDMNGQWENAINAFDKGIGIQPYHAQLHYNKAVTLASHEMYEDAFLAAQQSVSNNNYSPEAHHLLGRLAMGLRQEIPALLALLRTLILDPESYTAAEDLKVIEEVLAGKLSKGEGKFNLTLFAGKETETAFKNVKEALAISTTLDFEDKFKSETTVERAERKLNVVFGTLPEEKPDFFVRYYVPYFQSLKRNKLVKTLTKIIYLEEKSASEWREDNPKVIEKFYKWSGNYDWKKQ